VAYLVICFSFGLAGGIIGRVKGSSFVLWFLISAIVPFAGLLAALLYRNDRDELRRRRLRQPSIADRGVHQQRYVLPGGLRER